MPSSVSTVLSTRSSMLSSDASSAVSRKSGISDASNERRLSQDVSLPAVDSTTDVELFEAPAQSLDLWQLVRTGDYDGVKLILDPPELYEYGLCAFRQNGTAFSKSLSGIPGYPSPTRPVLSSTNSRRFGSANRLDVFGDQIDPKPASKLQTPVKSSFRRPPLQNKYGWTCLHEAARCRQLDIVRYLVRVVRMDPRLMTTKRFCTAQATAEKGCNVLRAACHGGSLEVVQFLIETCGMDPMEYPHGCGPPTFEAAFNGHFDILKYLLEERHVDPQAVSNEGTCVLHEAIAAGSLRMVRYLAEDVGVDVRTRSKENGYEPIHAAAKFGHPKIFSYLRKRWNISEKTADASGSFPAHYAAASGHLCILRLLSHPNRQSCDGNRIRPLHLAAREGHAHVVIWLIRSHETVVNEAHLVCEKTNCNARDYRGWTPLHQAVLGYYNTVSTYFRLVSSEEVAASLPSVDDFDLNEALRAYTMHSDGYDYCAADTSERLSGFFACFHFLVSEIHAKMRVETKDTQETVSTLARRLIEDELGEQIGEEHAKTFMTIVGWLESSEIMEVWPLHASPA